MGPLAMSPAGASPAFNPLVACGVPGILLGDPTPWGPGAPSPLVLPSTAWFIWSACAPGASAKARALEGWASPTPGGSALLLMGDPTVLLIGDSTPLFMGDSAPLRIGDSDPLVLIGDSAPLLLGDAPRTPEAACGCSSAGVFERLLLGPHTKIPAGASPLLMPWLPCGAPGAGPVPFGGTGSEPRPVPSTGSSLALPRAVTVSLSMRRSPDRTTACESSRSSRGAPVPEPPSGSCSSCAGEDVAGSATCGTG